MITYKYFVCKLFDRIKHRYTVECPVLPNSIADFDSLLYILANDNTFVKKEER